MTIQEAIEILSPMVNYQDNSDLTAEERKAISVLISAYGGNK